MLELLIPFLTFVAVVAVGGAVLAARAAEREPVRNRIAQALHRDGARAAARTKSKIRGAMETIGTKVAPKGPSLDLQQRLARAGFHAERAAKLYLGAKISLFSLGFGGLSFLVFPLDTTLSIRVFMILFGATALSFLPNIYVSSRRGRRQTDIRQHLPDALDLLEISVSSGMGLDTAWNSVAEQIRDVSPPLADEMSLTNLELHLGAPRANAMRHMADRTDVEEISALVSVLIQSERFGTSIASALRTFAQSMREARSSRAEVAAEKMAVKLLFPMIVFIFPATLIVTVGPAAIVLKDMINR